MKVAEPVTDVATRAKPVTLEPSTAGDAPAPVGADVSAIAATLMQAAPEVQPAAIQEHANQAKADALKDSKGVLFNEAIHVKGADGKPVKTVSGEWAKRRGRKAGASAGVAKSAPVAGSVLAGGGAALVDPQQAARTAGAQAASLLISLGMMLGGEEWLPIVIPEKGLDEMAAMQKAFGDYFVATNRKDIPPGVALSFCVLAYAAPRCFRPTTRERLGVAKAWAADKLRRVYVWYKGRKER